jgi:hypothetical protein
MTYVGLSFSVGLPTFDLIVLAQMAMLTVIPSRLVDKLGDEAHEDVVKLAGSPHFSN